MTDAIAEVSRRLLASARLTLSVWDDVNAPMVRHWCEVIGNRNPRYAPNGEVPATMLHVWTMPGFGGIFPEGVAVDLLREASRQFSALGFTGNMAVRLQQHYRRPPRIGERLHREIEIETISPVKRTVVGDGVFITEVAKIFSGAEHIGSTRLTLLCFCPGDAMAPAETVRRDLPERTLKLFNLTAHFITSAAIATRDFEDVHMHQADAITRGVRDIYINIMTTLGLVQRFIEERHGTGLTLEMIDLHLLSPAHPGDTLEFASPRSAPGQPLAFQILLREGVHARGTATIREP